MKSPHISQIRHDAKITAYQLNPAAFAPFGALGLSRAPAQAVIAITGPYNEGGKPIGAFFDGDEFFGSIRTPKDRLRPYLCFHKGSPFIANDPDFNFIVQSMLQAGPTLILNGKKNIRSKEEKFGAEAVRQSKTKPTAHPFFGIRTAGNVEKLILGITPVLTLSEVADYLLELGCHSAAKLDGGSCAYLECPQDGIRIGNQGRVPTMLCFKDRTK